MKSNKVTFIAEIGLNHNGNFGLLFELIKQAALSGADLVKFQLGWRSNENEINNIGYDEIELILKCCNYHDIQPMFSIFNNEAFELASKFNFQAFKIASRTVIDEPELVKKIIRLGKRTFISLGMWEEKKKPFEYAEHVNYLWCKSEYPAYPWLLKDFPNSFSVDTFAGYSDHSVGIEIPLMAIMRGAEIIEKHLTLDKSDTTIRDHALSATPNEFESMVRLGKGIRRNLNFGV